MRRVLLASLLVALSLGWMTAEPAGATANAGPWDVTVAYRTAATSGSLYASVRISTDSDDDVTGRYVSCFWYTRTVGNVHTWSGPDLVTHGGMPDEVGKNEGEWGTVVGGNYGPYHSISVNIIRNGASGGCDNSANFLPIRGRGGVTSVPTGQIVNRGTTDTAITLASMPVPLVVGANPPATLPTTDATCSRVLAQNNGSNVATFDGTLATVTGITDTYSWDFGDSSTDATTIDAQHIYPATSSMPEGGWTATLTVTRTGNGTTYEVGPSVKTCALRVDYLNPEQTEAGSGEFDEPDDSDCPTGFGWINPLAILKVLKCLLIPSEDSVNSLGELWGDVTTKAPFSWAYEIVSLPGHFFDDMADSATDAYEADQGGTVCTNLTPGLEPVGGTEITNCEIANTIDGSSAWDAIQYVITGLFLIALAMGIYQTVVWTVS